MTPSVLGSEIIQNLYSQVLEVREGDLAHIGTLLEFVEGIVESPQGESLGEVREIINRLLMASGSEFAAIHGELKETLQRKGEGGSGTQTASPTTPSSPQNGATLYEKLGGAAAVKATVEEFYQRVLANPSLAPVFEGVELAELRRHQALFLSQALGGPKNYEGRDLAEVHHPLKITRQQFTQVATHLGEALLAMGVATGDVEEVMKVVAPLEPHIVARDELETAAMNDAELSQPGDATDAGQAEEMHQPPEEPPKPPVVAFTGLGTEDDSGVEPELFEEFADESLIHLESIELNILSLETDPGNLAIINNIFRPFHTIKGVAGFLALGGIHRVCHELENLLDGARKGKLEITGEISDLILETVDLLKEMIPCCREPNHSECLAAFSGQVETLVAKIGAAGKGKPLTKPKEQPPSRQLGKIMVEKEMISQEKLEEAVAVQQKSGGPLGQILIQQHQIKPVQVAQALRDQREGKNPADDNVPSPDTSPTSSDNIRVRISLLDQLMNLAGELVLGRNQLMQKLGMMADDIPGLNSILHNVDRVTSEVQEAVMQTRMQPLGGLFSRFHRVIRDLSRAMGKKINFVVSGETVELDKTLIEALGDPLTHLIRNCADHGIESPEIRIAAGKPETGHISLSANHEGGKVHVKVADDGAGVDITRVKEKAVENGLITREDAGHMSEREVLRLLFAPGFSTATTVTGVSGRGVGMDVVLSNIEKIGGTVEITTELGHGTTFLLDLPLTLAILPALIVSSGEQRFAIPQTNLLELVHLEGKDAQNAILEVRGSEVYSLRGAMLPLVRLGRVLQLEDSTGLEPKGGKEERTAISIVVMAVGNHQIGLIVDRIYDTEEIVVKPLNPLLKEIGVYAGATLMGDGKPALILDMPGLVRAAELTVDDEGSEENFQRGETEENKAKADNQTILVFNINPAQQMAVPLTLISRLETVSTSAIKESVSGKIIPYRDKLLPLIYLEDHLKILPPAAVRETVKILVFEIEHPVGLVVSEIIDSIEVPVSLDDSSIGQKGFSGMAMVNSTPTAFLDIYQVIEMVFPVWFQHDKDRRKETLRSSEITLLLAEDSNFYRNIEKNYLRQEGFTVIEAEDGQIAYELLLKNRVDLVVTDIEMPNLDGFQLTEKIRATEQLRHLPVIAVTSLSHDEERARGMKAGLDAYLVKLKKEELMKEVQRLLAERRKTN